MNSPRIKIIAKAGQAEVTAVVVGAVELQVPPAVEDAAARLAKKDASEAPLVAVDGHHWLVCARPEEDWLVGGEDWRSVGAAIVKRVREAGFASVEVPLAPEADAEALVEGCLLGDYLYTACRSGAITKRRKITVRLPGQGEAVKRALQAGQAQNLARELADGPPNAVYPQSVAEQVQREFADSGVTVQVISGCKALHKARLPGLVQVGRGSRREPALVKLTYKPKKKAKTPHRLALVGKGITFDSGGISLKPGAGMWEMKGDMGGAAAMIGAMRLIADRQPPIPVTAYIALAENMPDGDAQRPGDIYQARNGTWVHVDNTDAEGRLVLADCLTLAGEEGATHIVDAATLTGAALIGLGKSVAAVMGSDPSWVDAVRQAGLARGEELWPLPLYGEYKQQLEHPHADINNTGGRPAGTITAGLFLQRFVAEDVAWAHVDLAGPAMRSDGWRYLAKGMTGFGTRCFAAVAERLAVGD